MKKTNEFIYTEEVTGEIVNIPIRLLHHHHQNPRKDFGDLTELTESIKANGIFQNLTVVPFWFEITGVGCDDPKQQAEMGYLVVIGNRRLEAAKAAGLETLPCIISDMNHKEQLSTMLAENMQRADLTIYEQANGFQMMLDLGESIEDISKVSGFSESTIRRRVKLTELDQEKLKEVSSRQISIADLERLNQIKDINTRNNVLNDIGTNNFDFSVTRAIKEEKRKTNEETVRSILLSKGLEEIDYGDSYKGDYKKCLLDDYYYNLDKITENFDTKDAEVFAISYGAVYLKRRVTEEEKQEEKNEENERAAEREKTKNRVNQLDDISDIFAQTRKAFIDNLPVKTIKDNWAYIVATHIYCSITNSPYIDEDDYIEEFRVDFEEDEDNFSIYTVLNKISDCPERAMLRAIIMQMSDGDTKYHQRWDGEFTENENLDNVYDLLLKLGYKMSDMEKQYATGKHPLFAPYDN